MITTEQLAGQITEMQQRIMLMNEQKETPEQHLPGVTAYRGYVETDTIVRPRSGLLTGTPGWVWCRKAVDPDDLTKGYVYGWKATVTHASQHPEAEEAG